MKNVQVQVTGELTSKSGYGTPSVVVDVVVHLYDGVKVNAHTIKNASYPEAFGYVQVQGRNALDTPVGFHFHTAADAIEFCRVVGQAGRDLQDAIGIHREADLDLGLAEFFGGRMDSSSFQSLNLSPRNVRARRKLLLGQAALALSQ